MQGDEERWARGGGEQLDARGRGDSGKDDLQELPWLGFGKGRRARAVEPAPTLAAWSRFGATGASRPRPTPALVASRPAPVACREAASRPATRT